MRFLWLATVCGLIGWALIFVAIGSFNHSKAKETWIGVNTVSKHLSPAHKYNESNLGLFYERRTSQDWGYQVGFYKNSFNRDTAYLSAIWQPLLIYGVRIGGFAGAFTGYRERADGSPRGGLVPVIGGLVSYDLTKNLGINVLAVTSVVGLQLKVRW